MKRAEKGDSAGSIVIAACLGVIVGALIIIFIS
jgi:hypothetical protein